MIYLVVDSYSDDFTTYEAFSDYEKAINFFSKKIADIFLDMIHDSNEENEKIGDFLNNLFSDGFAFYNGIGDRIWNIPNFNDFNTIHDSYLEFQICGVETLTLTLIHFNNGGDSE